MLAQDILMPEAETAPSKLMIAQKETERDRESVLAGPFRHSLLLALYCIAEGA